MKTDNTHSHHCLWDQCNGIVLMTSNNLEAIILYNCIAIDLYQRHLLRMFAMKTWCKLALGSSVGTVSRKMMVSELIPFQVIQSGSKHGLLHAGWIIMIRKNKGTACVEGISRYLITNHPPHLSLKMMRYPLTSISPSIYVHPRHENLLWIEIQARMTAHYRTVPSLFHRLSLSQRNQKCLLQKKN